MQLTHHPQKRKTIPASPPIKPNSVQQAFHYLVLSSNELWTEIPGFMLDAIALPSEITIAI